MYLKVKNYSLLILVCIVLINSIFTEAQSKKTNVNSEKGKDNQNNALQIDKSIAKKQAIETLHNILDSANQIPSIKYKTIISIKASEVLWKYEPIWTESKVTQILDSFLQEYNSVLGDSKEKLKERQLAEGTKLLIKSLAQRNVRTAETFQKRFLKIKESYLENSSEKNASLDDKLELASSGLDKDTEQSIALATKVIQYGIPSSFPKYLFELQKKNPLMAENLYQKALFYMNQNNTYTSEHVILLASFAFNESVMLVPIMQILPNNELKSGIFTFLLSPPNASPNLKLVDSYLKSTSIYINRKIQNQTVQTSNISDLAEIYFLTRKLAKYTELYQTNGYTNFSQISEIINSQILSLGVNNSNLEAIEGYAERSVTKTDIFKFITSQSLLEKAENSENEKEKENFLVRAILRLIEEKNFNLAEETISKLGNSELEEKLSSFNDFQFLMNLIETKQIDEVSKKLIKIKDKEYKSFLLLKICEILTKLKKNTNLYLSYFDDAEKQINSLENGKNKAKSLLALANFKFLLKQPESNNLLQDAIKIINKSSDFDENNLQLRVSIPTTTNYYSFTLDSGFEECFANATKFDSLNTQSFVEQIENREINTLAKITVAKTILAK